MDLNRSSQLMMMAEAFDEIESVRLKNCVFDLVMAAAYEPVSEPGHLLLDMEARVLSVDGRGCEILSRERAELCKIRLHDITFSPDLDQSITLLKLLRSSDEPRAIRKRYLGPDGKTILVKNDYAVLKDGIGPNRLLVTIAALDLPS